MSKDRGPFQGRNRMSIPLNKPFYSKACRNRILAGMEEILASGTLMMGPWTEKFEGVFAELTGMPYAISTNTCTTALTIALRYYDVRGGEVLVPSGSFVTDVSSVIFAGGIPVMVDMNPETLAFDLDDLERKVTSETRGIIWVHLTGFISPEYQQILDFARKRALFVIEDASHAHGAAADGRIAGSLGDVGCFSFYPTKILSSGTGGLMTTRDEGLMTFARQMRLFGKQAETGEIIHLGNDWFMDEIRACVGYHQARELGQQLERRRGIARRYHQRLANQPGLRLLQIPDDNLPAWYQYAVFLDRRLDRGALVDALRENHKIQTKAIYRPTHEEQVFRQLDDGTLGKAADTLHQSLCLPMFFELTDEQSDIVASALIEEVRAAL